MHETLLENQYKDVSESECNIVHETLSQNNFADLPVHDITELKNDKHNGPSMTEKVTSYFKYSSAVKIYWINSTLLINKRSWQHQHKINTISR